MRDLLTTKAGDLKSELIAVPPSAPLTKVIGVLREKNVYEVFIAERSEIGMVTVRDVLRAKNIHSRKASSVAIMTPKLSCADRVVRAAKLMTDYRVRALPIVNNDRIIGEITALSICKALHSTGKVDLTIDKVMTSHPVTLIADDPLAKAKAIMNRRNIDHLPIRENGKVVGMLTSIRLLDSMVPPERSSLSSRTPETLRVDQILVRSLMERPLMCDVREDAHSVLGRLIDEGRTYALVGFAEELQGIVTYRDFVRMLVRRKRAGIPVYLVGLPESPFEADAARTKFTRAINFLRKSFPEILEARSILKTTSPTGKKGRKHYEVKAFVYTPRRTFVYSRSGWDLASIFDVISDGLKKAMSKRKSRRRYR
jgi:CBS domain-containing protein